MNSVTTAERISQGLSIDSWSMVSFHSTGYIHSRELIFTQQQNVKPINLMSKCRKSNSIHVNP